MLNACSLRPMFMGISNHVSRRYCISALDKKGSHFVVSRNIQWRLVADLIGWAKAL